MEGVVGAKVVEMSCLGGVGTLTCDACSETLQLTFYVVRYDALLVYVLCVPVAMLPGSCASQGHGVPLHAIAFKQQFRGAAEPSAAMAGVYKVHHGVGEALCGAHEEFVLAPGSLPVFQLREGEHQFLVVLPVQLVFEGAEGHLVSVAFLYVCRPVFQFYG